MASITTFRGRRCTRVRRVNSTQLGSLSSSTVESLRAAPTTVRNSIVASQNLQSTPIPELTLQSSKPSATLAGPEVQLPPVQTTASANNFPLVPTSADASSKLRSLEPGAGAQPTGAAGGGGGGRNPNAPIPPSNPTPAPQDPSQPQPIAQPQNPQASPAGPLVSPAASVQPQVPDPESPRPAVTPTGQNQPFLAPGQGGQVGSGRDPLTNDGSPFRSNTLTPLPAFQSTGITSGPGPVFTGFGPGGAPKSPLPTRSDGGLPFTLSFSPPPSTTATGLASTSSSTPKMMSMGAVAGVISGVVALTLISTILFFVCRKRRRSRGSKEQIQEPVPDQDSGSRRARSVTPITQHVRALFAKKKSDEPIQEAPRASTPSLERGERFVPRMAEVEIPRIRASSEPASRLSAELDTIFGLARPKEVVVVPNRDSTPSSHRRSVSSVNGVAYPILSEANNPFRDPDPNATLRIVNPDLSVTATPTSLKSHMFASPAPSIMGAQIKRNSPWAVSSPVVPSPVRPNHRRNVSIDKDPFKDPEPNPFADPAPTMEPDVSPISEEPDVSPTSEETDPSSVEENVLGKPISHIRSRTLTKAPSQTSSTTLVRKPIDPAHLPKPSGDSAYISSSPQSQSTIRYNPLRVDRNSISSAASSELSYQNWGEPGPTRPVSYDRTDARVSDPFDLDRPEVLGFMKSDMRFSGTTVSRSGSQRSSRYPASERRRAA